MKSSSSSCARVWLFALVLVLFGRAAAAQTYALGNRVWFDADNSSSINNTETGINGVAVDLYAASDLTTPVASDVTSNGGYYLFDNLAAGDYVVAVSAANFGATLTGYWSTGFYRTAAGAAAETTAAAANGDVDSDDNGMHQFSGPLSGAVSSGVVTLGPGLNTEPTGEPDLEGGSQGQPDGQANMTVDFGFYTIRIGNLVWNDLDNDGHLNGAETGFELVTVELRSADGSALLGNASTGPGGIYAFDGLAAGDYLVRLPAINFNPAGILRDYRSSTGSLPALAYEPAPDADVDLTDSDDNGTETNGLLGLGGFIQSAPVTLDPGAEASSVDSSGQTIESRVDFGVNNSPQIDLVVTNTDGQSSYVPGETLHYAITVTNNGPADAIGMSVHDDRPVQIASWTWTCAPGTPPSYNCTGDGSNPASFTDSLDLPQLASVTYNVAAVVGPAVSGSVSNMVYVVPPAGMTDMTNGNNIATDVDAPVTLDLAVTKTDGQASYSAGGTVSYTIVVTNHGPADAIGMTVSDARPSQVASWTWTCDAGTPSAYECTGDIANPATFTDTLDLPAFASLTYHVTAQIADSVSGDMSNSVQVTVPAGLTESEPSNNEAVDVDTLAATTLAIAKSASPDPVVPGQTVIYTIQVSNTGAVNATNLTVTDPLPSGLTFASASGGGWTCNEVSGVVTCTRALLVPGDAPPIVIAARVGVSPGLVTNTASVSGGNAGAAQASVGTAVVAAPKIPTLSGVGMMAFALILAGIAALIMRQF